MVACADSLGCGAGLCWVEQQLKAEADAKKKAAEAKKKVRRTVE